MTRPRRRVVGGLACVALLAGSAAAWARLGTVTTLAGERFEGDVVERADDVVVTLKGNIPITRQRNEVTIEYAGSAKEQLEQKLAKLDKNDVDGRIAAARWAIDKREPELALDALDAAINIDPNNETALQLRTVVERQQHIQMAADTRTGDVVLAAAQAPAQQPPARRAPAATPARPAAAAAAAPAATPATKPKGPVKTRQVTPAEVNRIRQLELQKNETVQVRFQNDVKHRFLQNSGFTPAEFNRMNTLSQAHEILANGGSKMQPDVLIVSDPIALAQFKRDVQRHLLPGCATAACHGTFAKAGNFMLHNPANKESETYTNFLLLQQYPISASTGGAEDDKKIAERTVVTIDGRDYSMIDRQKPENSLLLLYGMPPKDSPLPHPEVQNYKGIFKGRNDPKYQATYNWIHDALAPVPPEYDIDLTREPAEGTTRPTRGGASSGGAAAPAGGARPR